MTRTEHPLEILLVEDNPNDVTIAKRALSQCKVEHKLTVARDGQEALNLLLSLDLPPRATRSARPDLILLDLNLPRVDGFEVIRAAKGNPVLQSIPIVVLTTSERDEDVARCYQYGANTFISKPVEYDRFLEIVRVIHAYWAVVARLPGPARV